MADKEKVVTEESEVVKATVVPEPTDGPGRKIIKWVLTGLVAVATGAIGFLAGRSSVKDEEENADEDTPAE